MTALPIPTVELNDGRRIPQLGLGAYKLQGEEAERVVGAALRLGYRHIDTARLYENESAVGRALAESGIPRDELFVTSKLWNADQPEPRAALEASLSRLGLDRVDLYLIHWPAPAQGTALTAWRGLIELARAGLASSIGVSNFEIEHLRPLIDETGVVPAVNQIELHPLHQRRELRDACRSLGIAIEAWGPLTQGKSGLLDREEIVAAARAHGKTPAQIVLRWHVEQGTIIFPKTSRSERLVENAALFDFELSGTERDAIDALDEQRNFGPDPRSFSG